jgi:hypothetical protein
VEQAANQELQAGLPPYVAPDLSAYKYHIGQTIGQVRIIKVKEGHPYLCLCRCGSKNCQELHLHNDAGGFRLSEEVLDRYAAEPVPICPYDTDWYVIYCYDELAAKVRQLKIKSEKGYNYARRMGRIRGCPKDPSKYPEWQGWKEFLGK